MISLIYLVIYLITSLTYQVIIQIFNMSLTDYNKIYFPVKNISKIVGQPTSETVTQLKRELIKNARSVPSNLGGGNNGHLFLVLPEQAFLALPGTTPVVRPNHPGQLTIPANATAAQIATLERQHKESETAFFTFDAVEKALLAQVEEAVDQMHLLPIINQDTQSFEMPLRDVMTWLMDTFQNIDEGITTREIKLAEYVYDPRDPITEVWNMLTKHRDAAARLNVPVTDAWLMDRGIYLLQKSRVFLDPIKSWKICPEIQKTWANFMLHFNQAHRLIQESNELTLRDQERQQHSANLVESIVQGLRNEQETTLQANATTQESELRQIQAQLAVLQNALASLNTGNTTRNSRTRARNRTKYCWTHGACGHGSSECRNKAEGHQDTATFQNKMNGSTSHCPST